MKLSSRSKSYMIPEYSLTGDLLSYLTCGLQYRYQNKGTLPPSMPIQLWFGEFIHGVMEEAYLKWESEHTQFPWDWKKDIRPIEDIIDLRLQVRGLYPKPDHFFTINHPDINMTIDDLNEYDHKKLASARAEKAINVWGADLFPLMESAEVLIKGLREMPYTKNDKRSKYYGISGVIDVLSLINMNEENKIVNYLKENEEFNNIIKGLDEDEYEIIIDYKGMKRPPNDVSGTGNESWDYHERQILTYSWLRSKQEDKKPVAGIIFYLNELVPSIEDLKLIKEDIHYHLTDVGDNEKYEKDIELIENWDEDDEMPKLSEEFKVDRSIRIIPIDDNKITEALEKFDNVVEKIETSIIKEINGCKIQDAWKAKAEERTCEACDFKTFCKGNKNKTKDFIIP
ncbi:MAG: PD-(D/E)XK nuclease family protein [Methanobrevibacter sp.]|nr:PD-(D/E)XK nuclease family protein [Methanobrevibacter sp.]